VNGEVMHGHTAAHEGGTFIANGLADGFPVAFADGFQVGIGARDDAPCVETDDPTPSLFAMVAFWVRYLASTIALPVFVGSWIEDGVTFIEPSVRVMSRDAAVAIGDAFKEACLWDWAASRCLWLDCADCRRGECSDPHDDDGGGES